MTRYRSTTLWAILLTLLVLFALMAFAKPTATTAQQEVVFGDGPFDFPDPREGLDQLSSYKATLTVTFDGTDNGKPVKWAQVYTMLFSKQPALRELRLEKKGDLSDLYPLFKAEKDGTSYERSGNNPCQAAVFRPDFTLSDQYEPALFLDGVIGADDAGSSAVNGAETKHYTFDERALGQQGLTQSKGELRVSSAGGYLVRYLLTTKGKPDYFGGAVDGTIQLDYELTDANKPVTIALPADCPAGMVNAPTLPDASKISKSPGFLTFITSENVASASAFYQKQLPGLGWKTQGEPTIAETSAALSFEQGEQRLILMVRANAGVTHVNILLENAGHANSSPAIPNQPGAPPGGPLTSTPPGTVPGGQISVQPIVEMLKQMQAAGQLTPPLLEQILQGMQAAGQLTQEQADQIRKEMQQ